MPSFSHAPSKIAKSIRRKKGPNSTSALHANSRDARRLNRSTLRDEKLYRHALARDKANEKYIQRVEFFKEATTTALSASADAKPETRFDADLMCRLATTYVSRHDEELSQLASTRRVGRPAPAREVALRSTQQEETEELSSGFWMPDLRDEGTVEGLRAWDGGWSSLGRMRFVRISKGGKDGDSVGVRESRFPPNGLS